MRKTIEIRRQPGGVSLFRVLLATLLAGWVLSAVPAGAHQDPEIAGYVKVDGGRIWYRINGARFLAGPRAPLLFIHGGPGGTHRSGMALVGLAEERAVILYDQLDSGNSDHPGKVENWMPSHYVSEITSLRKALGLTRLVILGHSWGGAVAALYAEQRPTGLQAVILSSPLISTRRWLADADKWRHALPPAIAETLRRNEKAGTTNSAAYRAATGEYYARHMCRQDPCPNGQYRAGGPPVNRRLYTTMWGPSEFYAPGTLKNFDASPGLGKITIPSLFICGEFDEAAPASCQHFASLIEGSHSVIIPAAGHATMAENEALYLRTLRRFLHDNGL